MVAQLLVFGVVLFPFVAALSVAVASRAGAPSGLTSRMATVILGASLVSAAVLCGVVFARGTVHATLGPLVLTADAVAVVLSCLVLVLSGVIQVFAVRYLRGDPRQPWWAVVSNLLTGCTAVLVCAGTVGVFTVSWICAGGCLALLLAMYPRAPPRPRGSHPHRDQFRRRRSRPPRCVLHPHPA